MSGVQRVREYLAEGNRASVNSWAAAYAEVQVRTALAYVDMDTHPRIRAALEDAPAPRPGRADLAAYDEPVYFVVPEAERPPCPAEPAPYDLDVIRTDLTEEEAGRDVWCVLRAGETIPARLAHLPRRRCDHSGPGCPRFARVGQVLVQTSRMPRRAA